MSKRDPLRSCMNIIDKMLAQMVIIIYVYCRCSENYFYSIENFHLTYFACKIIMQLNEDPTFKPQGGKLGENDMDYDSDVKNMASLRRKLRKARERYYRYKR